MPEETTGKGGIREWRPSKALWFWSMVGAVTATIIVGFAWGGWVGPGTAKARAAEAAKQARAELAATVCVNRFLAAEDAQAQLAELKQTNSWSRGSFIDKGGWTTLRGMDAPVEDAAGLCADRLMQVDATPATPSSETPG
jgi:hypothetical protein